MGNKHKILEIGNKFERLTIVSYAGVDKRNKTLYNVVCDCGSNLICFATELRQGHTKSCGCLRSELSSKRMTSHGATKGGEKPSEFSTWCNMKQRCNDSNSKNYHRYGGRGIKVCDRWVNSYENFIADMGQKPSPKHTIDRKDNNGDYEPSNCRWATQKEQNNNTSTNRIIEYEGQKMTVSEASEKSGIKYATLLRRVRHNTEDIFNKKVRVVTPKIVLNIQTGIYYESMVEAAKAHNLKPITLTKNIERKGFYKNLNNAF